MIKIKIEVVNKYNSFLFWLHKDENDNYYRNGVAGLIKLSPKKLGYSKEEIDKLWKLKQPIVDKSLKSWLTSALYLFHLQFCTKTYKSPTFFKKSILPTLSGCLHFNSPTLCEYLYINMYYNRTKQTKIEII